jgi:hypothetical protein
MDRRTRNLFIAVLLVVVGVALGAVVVAGGPASGSGGPPGTETVVGVIVRVESAGLDEVTGFDLRTTDQGTMSFRLGILENGAQFPPGHLVEHQASAIPVRVWFRTEDGARVAVRLEDAP